MQFIGQLRALVAQTLGHLGTTARVLVILAGCLLLGGIIFWLCNELIYFFIARSYAEEIADVYDLNRGFARAVLWASFVVIVILAGWTLSFSKIKRRLGIAGLCAFAIGHSLLIARIDANFQRNGVAEKCYVMTRNSIKTLNRVGTDPETGRECRPLTPQIVEKLEQYRNGHRPTQITSSDPKFFDAVTGEPIVWFANNEQGSIELFDLMGFHPRTGAELTPITRQAIELWRSQNAKLIKRTAARVDDPDTFGFFDPTTGSAKLWYWRGEDGTYEFYDGPGFHARSGDAFKPVTRDIIADWRQRVEAAAAKKRADDERLARDAAERAALAAQQAREAADRERLQQQAAAEAQQKLQQMAAECDRLAGNPTDARHVGDGVSFDLLKRQADQAFDACTKAGQAFPSEPRLQYQLARAAQFKDKKLAFDILSRLTQASYPAAFDNLGGMYLHDRHDTTTAIALFRRGSELGDPDSMVSLVDLIDRGLVAVPNPEQARLALLQRAAGLGHAGAQRGYDAELQKANQARANQATQQQMLELFGAIVQGVARR